MTDAEKMEKLQEMMDGFITNIAQRAETAQDVKSMVSNQEPIPEDKDSDGWEDGNGWEDEDEDDFSDSQPTPTPQSMPTPTPIPQPVPQPTPAPQSTPTVSPFNTDDWKSAWMESLQATKDMFETERARQQMAYERANSVQPKQCDEVVFKKNTATFNGQPFEYKVLQKEANWGTAFTQSFTMDDKITNLEKLNEKIIEDIKLTFGSLNRITEIAVISGMFIINGVQYYPLCNDKNFLDGLPFDCADYFKSGLFAELLDFGILYKMPYLTTLKIDSMDFAVRKFAYDLGIQGKFRVSLVFKGLRNLKYLEIGDKLFEAPGKDDDVDVQDSIERHSKVAEVYDNFLVANVSTFRGWTFNNLKTFACNRGDKGFFKYMGGIVARTGITATVGVGELGLRTVGAVFKGGAKLLKKAFTSDL